MYKNFLIKTIVSLCRMVGLYNKSLLKHHTQVAYLSHVIGKEMHLDEKQLQDLVIAVSLHDVGLMSFSEDDVISILENKFPASHSLTMYLLFKEISYLYEAARIVRYHHVNYDEINNYEFVSKYKDSEIRIPISSYILRLADQVSLSLLDNKPILEQIESNIQSYIKERQSIFHPEVLSALEKIYKRDYIWLEVNFIPSENLLIKTLNQAIKTSVSENFVDQLAEIIGFLIDFKSPYTAGHTHAVSAVSQWLYNYSVKSCKYKKYECNIRLIGFLHDIGKLAIPLSILEKPDKLNKAEWGIMRSHAYYSHVALEPLYEMYPFLELAPLHHEKLDGSGYPFGLTYENLDTCARLLAVADIFTAITEERPYRGRMSRSDVEKVMQSMKGEKIDRDFTDFLLSHYDEVIECRNEAENEAIRRYNDFRRDVQQVQKLEGQ